MDMCNSLPSNSHNQWLSRVHSARYPSFLEMFTLPYLLSTCGVGPPVQQGRVGTKKKLFFRFFFAQPICAKGMQLKIGTCITFFWR